MVIIILNIRAPIWQLDRVKSISAGALVKILSTIGDGGKRLIEKFNGFVPVLR